MIRSSDFSKRKIGTRFVVVATGKAAKRFPGMISMNGTGAVIWDLLEKEQSMEQLVDALTARYEIDREVAARDAAAFLDVLRGVGAVVES